MPIKVFALLLALGLSGNVWGATITSPWTHTFASGDITTSAQASKSLSNINWAIGATPYTGMDGNGKGAQLGSGNNPQTSDWTMSTPISSFGANVKITSVSINISTASSGGITYKIEVGDQSKTESLGATTSVTLKTLDNISVSSGNIKITLNSNNKSKAIYIKSITVNFEENDDPYTVTFNAGSGTCGTSSLTEASAGAGVTLPTPTISCGDWTFAGWAAASQAETTTAPTLYAANSNYKPSSNCTLYAVYKITEGGGGSPTLTKMVKGNTIAAGDKLVIVANNTTYAMYQTSASSYVSYVTFSSTVSDYSDAKRYFEVSIGSTGGYCLGDATNGYLYSSSSTNLEVNTTNKTELNFIDNNDGTFKFQGKSETSRYLDCRTDLSGDNKNKWRFSSSGTQVLDLYKYSAASSTTTYNSNPDCGPTTYTIDFECNGATSGCPSQLTNQTNLPNPLPTTQQKTGYDFGGWYTNEGLTTPATVGAALTGNTTLYAKWNIINRTVTYNGDGQLNYTAKPTNATIEDAGIEVAFSVNTGYEITGVSVTMGGTSLVENTDFTWDQDDVTITPNDGNGITGNIVITFTTESVQACTKEITITQGTPSNGSFSLSQTGTVCIDGGNATVSVTNISPAEHYHFKQITATNGSVDNEHKQVTNISASTTINVEFEEDTKYTITFVDAVHGTDCSAWNMNSYAGTQIEFNPITDKTAVAPMGDCVADHYHFVGWVEEDTTPTQSPSNVITAGTTSINISKNVTYKAVWAKEEL